MQNMIVIVISFKLRQEFFLSSLVFFYKKLLKIVITYGYRCVLVCIVVIIISYNYKSKW
jgi:hypothetical protein